MEALGFSLVRCGPDGPEAWKIATEWNECCGFADGVLATVLEGDASTLGVEHHRGPFGV
jgi:hypothetical protein